MNEGEKQEERIKTEEPNKGIIVKGDIAEARKERLRKWLKDPYNLALIGVIVLSLWIRIYYFFITSGQTLWWDEAEYMGHAKNMAFDVPYNASPQRPPLFQYLASLALLIGLNEDVIKFILVLVPSVFLTFAVYLLGKEMFDKKIGLIAAVLISVSWTLLFWTARFQPDFFSMSFQVLAIYFMWSNWKKPNTKFVIFSGIFAALGFYFKVSALLVPIIFIVFILIKDRLSAIKKKEYYYFAIAFILTLVPYFIWSYLKFNTLTAFTAGYIQPVAETVPFGWYNLNFYYTLTEGILFILFILGLIYGLKFLLYADMMVKDKNKCLDPYLFSILSLVLISAFYIFHIKNTEDRWVFLWLPFIFFLVGGALMGIYGFIKKYSKVIGAIIVIVLLGWGAYAQYSHADGIIKNKIPSYGPVKDAGLWIKANSNPGDKVLSISYTQSVYYTERNVTSYSLMNNESELDEYILANKPRFLEISVFEPHPSWIFQQGRQNNYEIMVIPYLNSTLVSQNGQIVNLDIKPEVKRGNITFRLVYPQQQLNGMFVYEIIT